MTRINQIEKEALTDVLAARTKVAELTVAAENAVKDAKAAKTEFDLALAHLFLGHGLNKQCSIDMTTGAVKWPEEVVEPVAEVINSVPEVVEPVVKMSKTVSKKSKKVK